MRWATGVSWAGWAVAAAVSATVVCLLWVHCAHAGALWRDEVNSVNLATMRTLGEVWGNSQFDSFPLLWILLLRGWCGMGLGSDAGLRALGFLTALGSLGVLWFACRRMGVRYPLLCLAMFALNAEGIRRGVSVRAYGLGTALAILSLALMWDACRKPTRGRIAAAALAAVASVQTLYYCAVLLLACGAGAAAVAAVRRQWKRVLIPIGIGALAGLSFLPYLATIRRLNQWNILAKADMNWGMWYQSLCETMGVMGLPHRPEGVPVHWTLGVAGRYMVFVWVAMVVVALAAVGAAAAIRRIRPPATPGQEGLGLYCATTLVVGSVAYFLFLRAVGYYPNPWYYYAWMGMAALCADGVLGSLGGHWPWNALRIFWAAAVAALMLVPTWRAVQVRHTNVDQIAAELNQRVTSKDLVVVNPWTHGVSFGRYYHGPAPWLTIPPIDDHRTHRYDQLLAMMQSRSPMSPLLIQAEKALREGGRVWVVGDLSWPPVPGFIRPFPPATRDPNTWRWRCRCWS